MGLSPLGSVRPVPVPQGTSSSVAKVQAGSLSSSSTPSAQLPVDVFEAAPLATGGLLPSRQVVVGPTANLAVTLRTLKPGDVLRLRPGTYPLNAALHVTPGLANHRIQVLAADPAHPPLIQGTLGLFGASHWTLSRLRVQASVPHREALVMAGGQDWRVADCEFFGADHTGAYANVAISNDGKTPPTGYQFVRNRVHGAARVHPDADHNLYVNAQGGDLNRPGLIAHNIMFNAPSGENIKIGDGGNRAIGTFGLIVEHNTLMNANRQILVHSGVQGIVIRRNLLVGSHGTKAGGAGVYLNKLLYPKSVRIEENYAAALNGPLIAAYLPTRKTHYSSVGNLTGADPRLKVVGQTLVPQNRAAQPYGANAR